MTLQHLIERTQKRFPQAGAVEIAMLASQAVREFNEYTRARRETATLQTDAETAVYGLESLLDSQGRSVADRLIAVEAVVLEGRQLPRWNSAYGHYGLCWWTEAGGLGIGFSEGDGATPRPHYPDGQTVQVTFISTGAALDPDELAGTPDIDPRYAPDILSYIGGWLAEEASDYAQAEYHFNKWELAKRQGRKTANQGDTADGFHIRPLPI